MNKGLRILYQGSGISFIDDEKMKWKWLLFLHSACVASWTLSVLSLSALKGCLCAPSSLLHGVLEAPSPDSSGDTAALQLHRAGPFVIRMFGN